MTTMEQLKLEDTCLGELEAQKRLRNAVLKEAMPKAGQFGFRGDIALAFQEQVADEARPPEYSLEQVLAVAPADREALFALATISRDRGDGQTALRYAEQLSTHYPDDPQVSALRRELEGR